MPFIRNMILRMRESGLTDRLYKNHSIPELKCRTLNGKNQDGLGFEITGAIFMVLAIGLSLTWITYVTEIIENRYRNRL